MLTEGQILDARYTIVRRLKKGGMGAVYEASDNLLGAPVAIKENCVADPAMRTAFQREAQLLANLRHPSLPRCSDLLSEGESQYLAMEFIGGDDLAALMTKRRTWLPNETVADLAWQLLDALAYIHSESVQHRDIKPANIKLRDGHVYLLDFGLAYGQTGEMDTIAEFNWKYHSKGYASPEQAKCGRTTPASDLYSLAATLYYLLTNVQPADAEARFEGVRRDKRDLLEDIRVYNPAADERISRVIMQALSLSSAARPQSAEAMRELMFPEESAEPERRGVRGFLTTRLLSEILALGVFACILFFVIRTSKQTQISVPPVIIEQVSKPTPTPVKPVVEPSPSPVQEAARLAKEVELARQSGNDDDDEIWHKVVRAITLDENNPYLHFLLGDILWDTIVDNGELSQRIPEVLEEANLILRLVQSPRSEQEYVARAWANFAKANLDRAGHYQSRLDQAIADTSEVLTKYAPDSVAALTLRASATLRKAAGSQIEEETARRILQDYDHAIRVAPGYAQLYANQAAIYFALGRPVSAPSRARDLELARQGFEKAAGLEPRANFYKNLGEVYFEMGNFDKAIDNFSAATREDPAYYQAYVGLGEVFFQKERWDEAKTNYLEANLRNKTSDKLRKYVLTKLGTTYNNLKQFDRAEESCRLALKLDPTDLVAKQQLHRALNARDAGDR